MYGSGTRPTIVTGGGIAAAALPVTGFNLLLLLAIGLALLAGGFVMVRVGLQARSAI